VKTLFLIMSILPSGTLFTMCQNGPVPPGCCEPGDQMNVIMTSPTPVKDCEDYGGIPITEKGITVCHDRDF
jgi:hypothetical protein